MNLSEELRGIIDSTANRPMLTTIMFVLLSATSQSLVIIDADNIDLHKEKHDYNDDLKCLNTGEQEICSLACPVRNSKGSEPYLLYDGTLLCVGEFDSGHGHLIYRSTTPQQPLERTYRRDRYGDLLKAKQPLPEQHLLSFETIPDLPHPTRLVMPAPEWKH